MPDLRVFPQPRQHDAKNYTCNPNDARPNKEDAVRIHQGLAMMR